jgi:hypothetical protein
LLLLIRTTDAGSLRLIFLPGNAKAIYTLTIPQNAPRRRKVCFIPTRLKGSALLKEHGLSLTHPELAGPDTSMPQAIRSSGSKRFHGIDTATPEQASNSTMRVEAGQYDGCVKGSAPAEARPVATLLF